jgi:hypothetical protein
MIPLRYRFSRSRAERTRKNERRTHEKYEIISQPSRENWLHPTVADRRSDSYFDCDISAARLHVIRSEAPECKKSWLMTTQCFMPLKESKEQGFEIESLLNGNDSIIGACAFISLAAAGTYICVDEKIKEKILSPSLPQKQRVMVWARHGLSCYQAASRENKSNKPSGTG